MTEDTSGAADEGRFLPRPESPGGAAGKGAEMSDAAAEARAEDELDALLAVMEPPGCSEAAAKAREKGFYRLVGLDRSGLRAYDRQAFSTLERAEEWRDRRENVSLGITWHAVLPSDVVMVDGQWSGAAQEATRYGRPLFRKESRWSPDVPPLIASESIVFHAQPRWWIGELFLGPLGSGCVWSGWGMLWVRDHRIVDRSPSVYRGLYAWNIPATREFWSYLAGASGFVLVSLTASQRKRWRLSPLAEYAVFQPPGEADAPGGLSFARTPRRAVAVSAQQLMELLENDRLRPETERLDIYRPARLAPEGLVALGPDGYTTLEGARRAAKAGGEAGTEVRAVTRCSGLPADVTCLDDRSFESGRDRIAPGAGSDVAWVDPSGAGVPVVDGDGTGFVLGRSCAVRVAGGVVAERGAELYGAPAWLYRVFAKIKFDPLTPHVHGIVVKVNRKEVETWGLPDGTKAVLLARGREGGSVTWRCLDRDAFRNLRPEDALSVRRLYGVGEVPLGVDAGPSGVDGEAEVEAGAKEVVT